jgi:hypothetical protein
MDFVGAEAIILIISFFPTKSVAGIVFYLLNLSYRIQLDIHIDLYINNFCLIKWLLIHFAIL